MRRWFGLLIVGGLLALGGPGGRAHGQVTSDDINRSIKRGVTWLRGHRLANGSWPYQAHSDGATALCVYALLVAGVPPDDPAVDAGIRYFTGFPPEHTYTVTLNILAPGSYTHLRAHET